MSDSPMSRAELIRWLGDAIEAEVQKPFEEVDTDFVNECSNLLDELMDPAHALPAKEAQERLAAIGKAFARQPKSDNRKRRRKNIIRILAAAAVLACLTISVVAFDPWDDLWFRAMELEQGGSIEFNGEVYTYKGPSSEYEDLTALFQENKLDILTFKYLPDNLSCNKILHSVEGDFTNLYFNENNASCCINTTREIENSKSAFEEIVIYGVTGYYKVVLTEENSCQYIVFYYNNNAYNISSSDKATTFTIFEALAKEVQEQ